MGTRPLRRRVKTVIIPNMGKMTGGLEAMPTASPNDGLLDVGVLQGGDVRAMATPDRLRPAGRAKEDPSLEVFQARRIVIRTPSPAAG